MRECGPHARKANALASVGDARLVRLQAECSAAAFARALVREWRARFQPLMQYHAIPTSSEANNTALVQPPDHRHGALNRSATPRPQRPRGNQQARHEGIAAKLRRRTPPSRQA